MNRRANLLLFFAKSVICPRSDRMLFLAPGQRRGAELNLHLSQPTVLICSSYTSNPLFVFPSPPQRRGKKNPQMHVAAQTELTDAILFCFKKHLQQFLYRAPPEAQRYLKPSTPLIDTRDAFFSHPL